MTKKLSFPHSRTWTILAMCSYATILTATILAYLRLLPSDLKRIPYYDKIGHFMLFGFFVFFLDRALSQRSVVIGSTRWPLTLLLVTLYAIVDECLQGLSSARSLDVTDFLFGFLGIVFFLSLSRFFLTHPAR
jgi:VanZ family protein